MSESAPSPRPSLHGMYSIQFLSIYLHTESLYDWIPLEPWQAEKPEIQYCLEPLAARRGLKQVEIHRTQPWFTATTKWITQSAIGSDIVMETKLCPTPIFRMLS
jgi:hypothetical protein